MLSAGFEPREYQRKIAEVAASTNTLVVLPTGLGKTIIAIMVAAERLRRYPDSKVMVLAPTRPLVLQHLSAFSSQLELPPGSMIALTGTVDPGEREVLWLKARAVFATPQTVYNDVRHGRISLREVVLAVFDEAHRSVKDYTYTRLADGIPSGRRPPADTGAHGLTRALEGEGQRNQAEPVHRNVEARNEESEDVRTTLRGPPSRRSRSRCPRVLRDVILQAEGALQRQGEEAQGRRFPQETTGSRRRRSWRPGARFRRG